MMERAIGYVVAGNGQDRGPTVMKGTRPKFASPLARQPAHGKDACCLT